MRSWLMHRMHVLLLLLIRVPVGRILLRVLRHHRPHVLSIIWLIARMRPHVRVWRQRGVGAIVPSLGLLHGHGLPVRHVVGIHV